MGDVNENRGMEKAATHFDSPHPVGPFVVFGIAGISGGVLYLYGWEITGVVLMFVSFFFGALFLWGAGERLAAK